MPRAAHMAAGLDKSPRFQVYRVEAVGPFTRPDRRAAAPSFHQVDDGHGKICSESGERSATSTDESKAATARRQSRRPRSRNCCERGAHTLTRAPEFSTLLAPLPAPFLAPRLTLVGAPTLSLSPSLLQRKEIGHTLEQQLGHRQSQATQRRLRAHVRWLGLSRKAIATARKVEEAKKQWEEEQKEANTVQLLVQLRGITLDPKDSSLFHGASSDPYLIFLQLGKEIGRTEVIHKNLNPFWDAVKLVAQNHHPLTIQCWDYDAMSKDDIIGQCKVEIHELVAGHFMELSIADTTAPTGRKSTGKLKVLSLMVMDKKAMAESAKHLVTASMVWRAEELLAADTGIFQSASSDPYLVFHQMGKEIGRTNVVERDLNPTWDRIRLVLYANADVQIRCYDQDFLSADDLIGEVTVMGQDLLQPHTTLHLTNKNNEAILEQKGHRGSGKYGRLIVDDVYWYFNNGVSAKKAAEVFSLPILRVRVPGRVESVQAFTVSPCRAPSWSALFPRVHGRTLV